MGNGSGEMKKWLCGTVVSSHRIDREQIPRGAAKDEVIIEYDFPQSGPKLQECVPLAMTRDAPPDAPNAFFEHLQPGALLESCLHPSSHLLVNLLRPPCAQATRSRSGATRRGGW